MMNFWQKLFVKITVWLATEILLNFIGLNNIAAYSEFIFQSINKNSFVNEQARILI